MWKSLRSADYRGFSAKIPESLQWRAFADGGWPRAGFWCETGGGGVKKAPFSLKFDAKEAKWAEKDNTPPASSRGGIFSLL
ncbi:MAG: hypothetical protein GY845_17010 [Planctomycetes bacterium]|nr:hypothetical protein [Planctomycetota bacterium]